MRPIDTKLLIPETIRGGMLQSPFTLDYDAMANFENPLERLIKKEKEKMERDVMIKNTTATFGGIPCKIERIDVHEEFEEGRTYLRIHALIPHPYEAKFKVNEVNEPHIPKIKKVHFNPPVTVVLWDDNTKTIVRCENEDFDPEKGLAMAITKKMLGNKGSYFETIKKWVKPYEEEHPKPEIIKINTKEPATFKFDLVDVDINQLGDIIGTTANDMKVFLTHVKKENEK